MHRARSLQYFQKVSSTGSQDKLDSKLTIDAFDPYDPKLKGSARSTVMQWLQPAQTMQQLGRLLQLLLFVLAVCFWSLHLQARYQVGHPALSNMHNMDFSSLLTSS